MVIMSKPKQKVRQTERCLCGALIDGFSEQHVKANIRIHKQGKKHKELMEIKSAMEKKN